MANYWPEDTENRVYLSWEYGERSLQDLIEEAQRKWFGIDFKDLFVSSTQVRTSGCGCCPAASDDYTSFIVLEKK